MAKAIAVEEQQGSAMDRFKAQPQRLAEFLKDVRAEMRKVVAPSRQEVQSTTAIVLITVGLFSAYFFVVDYVVGQGVTQLIHHFTQR